MKRAYGYVSEKPGLHDFVIELFKACFMMGTDPEYKSRLARALRARPIEEKSLLLRSRARLLCWPRICWL